ncbi:MAG: DsrE family protein [Deltaproteobacteria bacterium]|nr:DsrE family protein [Deltaproteobacteria bacterium]
MSKAKALIIILSGADDLAKVKVGLNLAWRTKNGGAFEDVKVIFLGPGEDFIAKTDDKDILEAYTQVLANNINPQACVAIAEGYGIAPILTDKKIELVHAGQAIAGLMAEGYQPLIF